MSGTPDQVLRNIAFTINPEQAKYPARNVVPYTPDSCYGAVAHYIKEHGLQPHDTILMFGIHPTDVTHCILTSHHKVLADNFAKDGGFTEMNEGGLIYIAPNKELRRNVIIPLIFSKTVKWFEEQYFKSSTGASIKNVRTKVTSKVDNKDLEPIPVLSADEVTAYIRDYFSNGRKDYEVEPGIKELAFSLGMSKEDVEHKIYAMYAEKLHEPMIDPNMLPKQKVVDVGSLEQTEGELQTLINRMIVDYFVNIQTVQTNQLDELSKKLSLTQDALNKYIYDLLSSSLKQMKDLKSISVEGLVEYLPKNTAEGEVQKIINKMIVEYFIKSNVDSAKLAEFALRIGLTEELLNFSIYDLLSRVLKQIKLTSENKSTDNPNEIPDASLLPSLNM